MSARHSNTVDEIWKVFKANKVKIAYEIKQLFPFLHLLRDKYIISEEEFQKCQDKVASNPEVINEVIYDVLGSINSKQALSEIFCQENLNAYPNLEPIYQNLKHELQPVDKSSASEQRSNKLKQMEERTPESTAKKRRLKCADRIERNKRGRSQGRLVTRGKTAGLPKEKKIQTKKNQKFKNPTLPVDCGEAHGVLYKSKLAAGTSNKCIEGADGKQFTPAQFEAEGNRKNWRNWKKSIRCKGVTLESLIERGVLSIPSRTPYRKRKGAIPNTFPDWCIIRKPPKLANRENYPRPSHQSAQFELSEFPVQCGAITGMLHKHRFAAGSRKKCIRTEKRWCTPKEFVEMNDEVTSGSWDKDIYANGLPLQELIKDGRLTMHPPDCSCETCKEDMWPENDDTCSVCSSGGFLICCDLCPYSFHDSCHVPCIPNEKGKKWKCTFCKLADKLKSSASSSSCQEKQVLKRKMLPLQTLKCEFLLLKVWCQPESVVFAEDPMTIPNYGRCIAEPMWLKQVKWKLHNKLYERVGQFIEDMGLIFDNCRVFNEEIQPLNEIAEAGRKLQDEFEKSFREVFFIKPF